MSCDKDDAVNDGDTTASGYAPSSINGSEIVFNRDGKWNFSSITQGSATSVLINAELMLVATDKPVECTYRKTSDNGAKYTLSFWHKGWVSGYQDYAYRYNYYDLTLIFTSSTGGTYSGTRYNGTTTESRSGTFKLSK
jgi:hypothetical protein